MGLILQLKPLPEMLMKPGHYWKNSGFHSKKRGKLRWLAKECLQRLEESLSLKFVTGIDAKFVVGLVGTIAVLNFAGFACESWRVKVWYQALRNRRGKI